MLYCTLLQLWQVLYVLGNQLQISQKLLIPNTEYIYKYFTIYTCLVVEGDDIMYGYNWKIK